MPLDANGPSINRCFQLGGSFDWLDSGSVDMSVDEKGGEKTNAFCNDECIPDTVDANDSAEQESYRNQDEKLSADRYNQGSQTEACSLERRTDGDGDCCRNKTEGNGLQRWNTDGVHLICCREECKKLAREDIEDNGSCCHDGYGNEGTNLDGFHHSVLLSSTKVEGDDRNHTCRETEEWHEDEGLELEVDGEDRYCCCGEANEDGVHGTGHDSTDGIGDDGRETYFIDLADNLSFQLQVHRLEGNVLIAFDSDETDTEAYCLADDGCDSSTIDAHLEDEDEDWVENDVGDGTCHLAEHGGEGISSTLEDSFTHDGLEGKGGEHQNETCIVGRHGEEFWVLGEEGKERLCPKDTDQDEDQPGDEGYGNTIACSLLCSFCVAFSQSSGHEGCHTDRGTDAKSNHQVLEREGQRYCGKSSFGDHGDEDGVYNVI